MFTPESTVIGPITDAFLSESIVMLLIIFCVLTLIGILFITNDESRLETFTDWSASFPDVTDPSTGTNTALLIPRSTTLKIESESGAESNDIVLLTSVKLFCACITPSIETSSAPFADGVNDNVHLSDSP